MSSNPQGTVSKAIRQTLMQWLLSHQLTPLGWQLMEAIIIHSQEHHFWGSTRYLLSILHRYWEHPLLPFVVRAQTGKSFWIAQRLFRSFHVLLAHNTEPDNFRTIMAWAKVANPHQDAYVTNPDLSRIIPEWKKHIVAELAHAVYHHRLFLQYSELEKPADAPMPKSSEVVYHYSIYTRVKDSHVVPYALKRDPRHYYEWEVPRQPPPPPAVCLTPKCH